MVSLWTRPANQVDSGTVSEASGVAARFLEPPHQLELDGQRSLFARKRDPEIHSWRNIRHQVARGTIMSENQHRGLRVELIDPTRRISLTEAGGDRDQLRGRLYPFDDARQAPLPSRFQSQKACGRLDTPGRRTATARATNSTSIPTSVFHDFGPLMRSAAPDRTLSRYQPLDPAPGPESPLPFRPDSADPSPRSGQSDQPPGSGRTGHMPTASGPGV